MSTSTNPILAAIKNFTAPVPARQAAAKGLLPLSHAEIVEALIVLQRDPEAGIAQTAQATLSNYDPVHLLPIAQDNNTAPEVLNYLARLPHVDRALREAVIINLATPDEAIQTLANTLTDGSLLEAITINQQRLIRAPQITESLLRNPACTPEAERIARQIQQEFFEKEYGARIVEAEQEAQQKKTEAARANAAREDIPLDEIVGLDLDDYLLQEFEAEFGPIVEDPVLDSVAESHRIFAEAVADGENFTSDRLSLVQRIMLMNPRERVKLALRGDREARSILSRDSNRSVCLAVIKNPRITDAEVEMIAYMKNAPEQVLRTIASNRAWCKSYLIIHNLVRNPRTPISITLGLLPRLQTRDHRALASNKNVPDVIRKTAQRMHTTRLQNAH